MKKFILALPLLLLSSCGSKSSNTSITAVVQNGQATLSWTAASNYVADYYVEQSTGGGAFSRVASTIAPTTTTTVGGLTPGVNYTFRVQAHNTAGASAYTNTVSVTP